MRRLRLAALLLALAACTSDGDPEPVATTPAAPPATVSASPTASPPAAATRLVLTVGEGEASTVAPAVRRRLAAFGIARFSSDEDGQRATYRLPRALTAPELAAVQRPGFLAVRPVTGQGPPGECASAEGRQRVADRFAAPANSGDPVTGCDPGGAATYELGPTDFVAADIRSAAEEQGVIALVFVDAPDWAALTERYAGRQVAFVLDGEVLAAPRIEHRIEGGVAQIDARHLGGEDVRLLAAILRGGPYPVPVTVTAG